MTFHVSMTPTFNTVSREVVSQVDAPPTDSDPAGTVTRICWTFANNVLVPAFMLHAERVNEIERCEDGTCKYRSWETFGGPYARLVKWSYEKPLQGKFEDWVRDLKAYVEKP